MANREKLRLNDLDWKLLEVMADGRRYTPKYLYSDVERLSDEGDGWIRQRLNHLYDHGMIDKVGSSSMYEITEIGESALELREKGEITGDETPRDLGEKIRSYAHDRDSSSGK